MENNPNPQLPLLTYNQPRGTYGAEPVLLDFYLANAPLHLVAQENPEDEIVDWRIRVTLNSQSFIIDQWQPIYIKGIKPGKNWVQLEYLDELGEPLTNVYNNTARVFTYDPNSQDTLSKLVRGELTIAQARPIVDRGYEGKIITPEPQITPTFSLLTFTSVSPESAIAWSAITTPNWVNKSIFRASCLGIKSVTSKFFTSHANLVLKLVASKRVIKSQPLTPFERPFQNSSTVLPMGVSAPSPVTTTLFNVILFEN
jgi:hypothetical protein